MNTISGRTAGGGQDATARQVRVGPLGLEGLLRVPQGAIGIVLFAHGSGSSRLSPRNTYVAQALHEAELATLLFDLLTPEEGEDRRLVFDIELLAERMADATRWVKDESEVAQLPIGYFGASTGAAAALVAAAQTDFRIDAIVSRGGRPDLAEDALRHVMAPTQFIVGSLDYDVLELNRAAFAELRCEKTLEVVPGATHLFEEPGTLDDVISLARDWFVSHLGGGHTALGATPFRDRADAGTRLTQLLTKFSDQNPIVFALPRGGVPIGFEVAKALNAPLDVVLVRKIGAPGQQELAVGAIVDGGEPEVVLNADVVDELNVPDAYIEEQKAQQLAEIERRRTLYLGERLRPDVKGRTVLIVDDGIATGATVRVAIHALRRKEPAKIIVAVPVAPPDTLTRLREEADEVIFLAAPEPFYSIGAFYEDFNQVSDGEVRELLERAALFGKPQDQLSA